MQTNTISQNKISWQAYDRFYFSKSTLWFTIAIIIAIILMVFAVFSKDILTIIVFALAIVVFFIHAVKEPEEIAIALDGAGIHNNKKFRPYKDFESFWIFYDPPFNYILLKSRKHSLSNSKILLDDQNPVEIRTFLKEHLPEKEEKEGVMETIERILRI